MSVKDFNIKKLTYYFLMILSIQTMAVRAVFS